MRFYDNKNVIYTSIVYNEALEILSMQAPEPSLLQRALQEERKAQLELYRICFPVLISVVRRYHANDDEQVTLVNNAYLKILKGLAQYNENNYFFSWIKRIITNEVIDHFRRGKHYRALFAMDQEIPVSAATFASVDDDINDAYLKQLVEQLPESTRVVFLLFAVDGYSHREIGEMLGISEQTSKWHTKMARKFLKSAYLKELNHATGITE
jgi:RNA polymerase sigma factor (sigma-70 family)